MNNKILYSLLLVYLVQARRKQYFTRTTKDTVIATRGENVLLYCRVGEQPGLVQWTKDGFALGDSRDIPGYPRHQYRGEDTGVWDLSISNVELSDEGDYQCQVGGSEEVEPIVSDTVHLTVYVEVGKPQILQGEEVEVVEGREEVLQCMAEGRPIPELEWRDANDNLFPAKEYSRSMQLPGTHIFRTISVIKIVATKRHNNQKISCNANNSDGKYSKSSLTILKLLHKPEVKIRQKSSEGEKPEDTTQFNCFSKSNPRVTDIEWYLNGEKLPGETQDILSVKTVNKDMSGATVKCVVKNVIGSGEDQIKIQLKSGPLKILNPANVDDKEGEKLVKENKSYENINSHTEEDTSSSMILYIAIVILLITIIVLVVSMIIIFNKKTSKQVIQVKESPVAQNRFGQPDLLNNNENLLRDLLSTKNKGVEEDSVNILHPIVQPLHHLPDPPLELSRRSSLLSFFQEHPPEEYLPERTVLPSHTPSIISATNTDSGIHSYATSLTRNKSWQIRERAQDDDVDDIVLTMASIETSV